METLVKLDPYLIQWIKEWYQHQRLMAEVENLGKPVFKLPPGPQPWDLPLPLLLGSMDRDALQEIAHQQIDHQIRRIERQIEELESIKTQYQEMRKAI
jgi:hypothetical protein